MTEPEPLRALNFPAIVKDIRREYVHMRAGVYEEILIVEFEGGSALVDDKGIRALYLEGGYRGEKKER